jgi:calcineurin-like phosphoesterase family protein
MGFRKIDNYLNIYATGDLHLSHTLNRSIQKRGFNNPEQHNTFIRNQINSVVKSKSDILILGGDLGDIDILRWFLPSLTSCNIQIIIGNHDHKKELMSLRDIKSVSRIEDSISIKYGGNDFFLAHHPHLEFPGFYRNSYHIHFHTHGTLKPYLRAMDFGLDNCDMKPRLITDIVELRSQYSNIDEYGKRIEL